MFKKLFTKKKEIEQLIRDNELLRLENKLLNEDISSLKHRKELIGIETKDPAPSDSQGRKEYVARVSAFYTEILKPKLVHMISNFHKILEEETNDRDNDFVLKAGIYVCREFITWGGVMVNEQIANQVDATEEAAEQRSTSSPAEEVKMQINSVINQNKS